MSTKMYPSSKPELRPHPLINCVQGDVCVVAVCRDEAFVLTQLQPVGRYLINRGFGIKVR